MPEISSPDWARIMAHAWTNKKFREKLEKDPAAAIREVADKFGLTGRYDRIVKLPPKPGDLTPKQLRAIARGEAKGHVIHIGPQYCC